MARKQIRQIIENPKVAFTNFGRGMEFNTHSKAAFNNRVQMIKNLDITDDGKLELRKPVLPFILKNRLSPTPILSTNLDILQVVYFPALAANENRFMWIARDRTNNEELLITKSKDDVYITKHDISTFGSIVGRVDTAYLSREDSLAVKFPLGIAILTMNKSGGVTERPLKEYNPTGSELVSSGINLFNENPFHIKSLIGGSYISIDALLFSTLDASKNILSTSGFIKTSDVLYVNGRITTPTKYLIHELSEIKKSNLQITKMSFKDFQNNKDSSIEKKLKSLFPMWEWQKRSSAAGFIPEGIKTRMPFLALYDKLELSKIFSGTDLKLALSLSHYFRDEWDIREFGNVHYIGSNVAEHTEYELIISFDNSYSYGEQEVSYSDISKVEIVGVDGAKLDMPYKVQNLETTLSSDPGILGLSNFDNHYNTADELGTYGINAIGLKFTFKKPLEITKVQSTFLDGFNIGWYLSYLGTYYPPLKSHANWVNAKSGGSSSHYWNISNPNLVELPITIKPLINFMRPGTSYKTITNNHTHYTQEENTTDLPKSLSSTTKAVGVMTFDFTTESGDKGTDVKFFADKGINQLDVFTSTFSESDLEDKDSRTTENRYLDPIDTNIFMVARNSYGKAPGFDKGNGKWVQRNDNDYADYQVMDLGNPGGGYGVNTTIKTYERLVPNIFKNTDGSKEKLKSITAKFTLGAQGGDLNPQKSTVGKFIFSTLFLKRMRLYQMASVKPDDIKFGGATIIYNKQPTAPLDFEWKLKEAKHLFAYWEKLGLFGFDKVQYSNLPYNYVMLSQPGNTSYFPNTAINDVYSQDNHLINAVLPWKNNLLVFTESSTTMFIGTDLSRKQTISTVRGLTEFNSRTAKVVSNSVVFLEGDEVVAFVPAPGTDNAASLNTRIISKQIEPYIKTLNHSDPLDVYAVTFKHQYWLVYRFEKSTKILKYNWDKFAWTISEYDNYSFTDIFHYDADSIIAADVDGQLYNLEPLKIEQDISLLLNALHITKPIDYPTGHLQDIPGNFRDIKLKQTTFKSQPVFSNNKVQVTQFKVINSGTVILDGTEYRLAGIKIPEDNSNSALALDWANKAYTKLEDILTTATSISYQLLDIHFGDLPVIKLNIDSKDASSMLLAEGLVKKEFISYIDVSKWYCSETSFIKALTAAEEDAKKNTIGVWKLNEDEQKEIFYNAINLGSLEFGTTWHITFNEYDYEFQLGPRLPSIDTSISLDDASVLVGNDSNHPIPNQHFTIHVDGQLMGDHLINVKGKTTAIMHASPQQKWSFGISNYQRPAPSKHTQKVRRIATTIDVGVKGKSPNKLFIDSVVFRYRNTDRKRK